MDSSKRFRPKTVLLWEKVVDDPEAQRILTLFPSADIRVVKKQRYAPAPDTPASHALLTGKRTLMIGRTSSFVGYFDGELGSGVCCQPYYKLVPLSNGCPFYCTYCYLAFIYRKYAPFIKININYETMFKQIRRAAEGSGNRISFNLGEMLDSLALDHITNLTTMLIPFFSKFSNAYLMLLTKSNNIDNLLTLEPNPQTVVSWSLNSREMIETHELGAATLGQRIEAAKACQDHGYRIRLRIDPGILHANWKTSYADLIQKALTTVNPENITLGMLRLLPGHLRLAQAAYGSRAQTLSRHSFVKGASDGKLRYPPQQRIEFYTFLIDTIRNLNKDVSIGLCRETPDIWNILKSRCKGHECNCVLW